MLTNYHTHTVFSDGKDKAEDMVLSAIKKGFNVLGFSDHAPIFYETWGMKDETTYIAEIKRLKEKYKDKIEIVCGIEEDAYCFCDRTRYDYLLGSCHFFRKNGKYYAVDASYESFKESMQAFSNNPILAAENYYENFLDYLFNRKPDIIGHFDLLTKFDENREFGFLDNPKYEKIAENYIKKACELGAIFEINTGAISRGYRTLPYPTKNLLYVLKKEDAKITLTSDCHDKDYLDCYFNESRLMLKDIGHKKFYAFTKGEFKPFDL